MNKFLLKLVTLFNFMWVRLGVDTGQLEAILSSKIKMDSRRASVFNTQGRTSQRALKNQDWVSIFVFLFIGAFFLMPLIIFQEKATGFTLYFAGWMVMLAMTLITDFTEVLIDVRDNYILLPRPINDRTLTVSRLLHISIYLSKLVLAFILPALIFLFVKYGFLGFLTFSLQIMLGLVFVIFLVNLIYLFILRLSTPQKFKEIINYLQIIFTVTIFSAYYLLPRLIDMKDFENADILTSPFVLLLPPSWLAGLWSLLVDANYSLVVFTLSALAILTPIICGWLILTVLTKAFNQKMMAITEGGGASSEEKNKDAAEKIVQSSRIEHLADWICNNETEKAAFKWSWRLTARNRDYKLRVYPGFGMVPAFFVYFALNGEGSLQERWQQLLEGSSYLLLVYFCFLLLTTPLMSSQYSNKHIATWIFYASPLDKPGWILSGTAKAIVTKFFLPAYGIMFMVGLSIWGPKVIDDFMLGFANIMLLGTIILTLIQAKKMPFSDSWDNMNKGSNFTAGISSLVLASIMGGLHYLVVDKTPIVLAIALVVIVLWYFTFRQYQHTPWNKIAKN
ncbi:MAG: hypothetical protein R2828_20245 [Saprospiraceae bacterium]